MSWPDDDTQDYFSRFAISNSSLSALNPEQGGSPKRFQEFFERNKEKKSSLSLERGSLVHLYCENPNGFIVEDLEKPSEAICKIIEHLYYNHQHEIAGLLAIHNEESAKELSQKVIFEKAKEIGYGQSWKPETLLQKVNDQGTDYLNFLISANGKQIMSAETKKIVEACCQSLHSNPAAQSLLFDTHPGEHVYHEQEIYWEETFGEIVIPCKAKLDKLIINHKAKQIIIPDIKTTSKSAYNFQESFEFWRYYRQHAFYRNAALRFFVQQFPDKDVSEYEIRHYNIVVETCENPNTVVWEVPSTWIIKGIDECVSLLKRYAYHALHNNWSQSMEEIQNGGILILKDLE